MKTDIAVNIENYTQFSNIRAGVDELVNRGYSLDIYVPQTSEPGYKEMWSSFDDWLEAQNKYRIYHQAQKNQEYRVMLEPYPMIIEHKADYKIRYRYSNISAKPDIVYQPKKFLSYDAVLCSGEYDSSFLSVFTQTHITGNMKYDNFRKESEASLEKYKKPVLLYLPTYGDCCSIDVLADELASLKEDFYIIAKLHHGTNFLRDESYRIDALRASVDELLEYQADLADLLSIASVVLTDNSGAIFEALYTETPVAVFCDDINKNRIGSFNATQYELYKEGILPYTSDKSQLKAIISQAMDSRTVKLQTAWNRKNFFHSKNSAAGFADIIERYIKGEVDSRRISLHRVLAEQYFSDLEKLESFGQEINRMSELIDAKEQTCERLLAENSFLKKQLSYYETGKLYRAAKAVYEFKGKL